MGSHVRSQPHSVRSARSVHRGRGRAHRHQPDRARLGEHPGHAGPRLGCSATVSFSQWPESLGLAATRDLGLIERFADTVRREYVAVGFRVALHPQIDLLTEPRWSRGGQTFGESSALTGGIAEVYIRAMRNGVTLGPTSVATMTKHFPGGGPQLDGEDPHFAYGREQVYPGGAFEKQHRGNRI